MTSLRKHIDERSLRLFRKVALLTVATVYLVILAGGVVRSTGAGMGCPDWPKCFGSWIPPTEESELPFNYKELYGQKLKGEVIFNATKTWIEYVNRLLGVLTGLMIFLTFVLSFPFRRSPYRSLFYGSLLALLLVGFQGWLGSKVVSFELLPSMVTLHMLLAILIVYVLLYVVAASYAERWVEKQSRYPRGLNSLVLLNLGVCLVQLLMGTQVREDMDRVIVRLGYTARHEWIENLTSIFYVHRSFSILVLALAVALLYQAFKQKVLPAYVRQLVKINLFIILIEIGTGVLMAYAGVPAFAQPIHLTLSILLLGVQFMVWLILNAHGLFKSIHAPKYLQSFV